jgi:hypothetical protein
MSLSGVFPRIGEPRPGEDERARRPGKEDREPDGDGEHVSGKKASQERAGVREHLASRDGASPG